MKNKIFKFKKYNLKRRDIIILVILIALFVLLSFIANIEAIAVLNYRLFNFFYNLDIELGSPFLIFMFLGTLPGVLIFTLIAFLYKKVKLGKMIIADGIIVLIVTQIIKAIVQHPRPESLFEEVILRDKTPFDFGFPSGHTALSISFAVVILPYLKKAFKILIYFYALSISLGRIYLGLHSPIDVLGGILLGIIIGLGIRTVFER